jgi:hypothetical protein
MSAIKPVRLQLSRRKGFNLQAWSRQVNGLEAVNCARPGGYGNPFVVGEVPSLAFAAYTNSRIESVAESVDLYRRLCLKNFAKFDCVDRLLELRGKNLACWCALPKPGEPDICHAAVLLELANR